VEPHHHTYYASTQGKDKVVVVSERFSKCKQAGSWLYCVLIFKISTQQIRESGIRNNTNACTHTLALSLVFYSYHICLGKYVIAYFWGVGQGHIGYMFNIAIRFTKTIKLTSFLAILSHH